MSKLFDEEWESATSISEGVIKALKKILFYRENITQEEAARFLFELNISCRWKIDGETYGEMLGRRISSGVLKTDKEVKIKLCEGEIKAWHELFAELLKVSTF